jgi:hypothetical protein
MPAAALHHAGVHARQLEALEAALKEVTAHFMFVACAAPAGLCPAVANGCYVRISWWLAPAVQSEGCGGCSCRFPVPVQVQELMGWYCRKFDPTNLQWLAVGMQPNVSNTLLVGKQAPQC